MELIVDGVRLRTPKVEGVVITPGKIWSANTGRLEASGRMEGTIVAIKHKVEISWPVMTMAEVRQLDAIASSMTPWHELQYTDMTGATKVLEVYFGDPSYTIVSPAMDRVTNVKISAIER